MSQVELGDGRSLEIRVSGPDQGPVVLFHHGTPGSVTPMRAIERAVLASGARLVGYSRAGYGGSTRHPGRSVADVVPDMAAILDHLGVDRAVTAGWSGGGPHAIATGALLPERIAGVLSIASVAPYGVEGLDFLTGMGEDNLDEFGAALDGEGPLRGYLEEAAEGLRQAGPDDIVREMESLLPQVDQERMTPELAQDLVDGMHHGLATSVDGWLDDDLAFCKPWGFDLSAITVPVSLWQGSDDLMVPFAHGQWLAAHLPSAHAQLLDGEGHLSIAIGRTDEMFAGLLQLLR